MEVLMNGSPGAPPWFPREACTQPRRYTAGAGERLPAGRRYRSRGARVPPRRIPRNAHVTRSAQRGRNRPRMVEGGPKPAVLRLEAARSARSVADGRSRKRGGALRRLMPAARREPRSSGRFAAKNNAASRKPFGRVARLALWPVRLPSFPRSPPLPRSDETPSRNFPSPKREPGERPQLCGATLRT
jgi:hypothetical protein